jgi:hypothetical protein
MSDMWAHPTLGTVLRSLSRPLPASDGLTTDEWLAACSKVLPRDEWVRLVKVVLTLEPAR